MLPSEVFGRFATSLDSHPCDDLTHTQLEFVTSLFEERSKAQMGISATNIVSSFGYSAELMEAPPEKPDQMVPPYLRVAFNHDPIELLA